MRKVSRYSQTRLPHGSPTTTRAVVEVLGRLIKDSHKWESFDSKLCGSESEACCARPEIEDLADTCRDLTERFEADPERLEEVEKRIAFLKKLQARYGKTPDELLEYRDTLDTKETELQKQEDDLSGIDTVLRAAWNEMRDGGFTQQGPCEGGEEAGV